MYCSLLPQIFTSFKFSCVVVLSWSFTSAKVHVKVSADLHAMRKRSRRSISAPFKWRSDGVNFLSQFVDADKSPRSESALVPVCVCGLDTMTDWLCIPLGERSGDVTHPPLTPRCYSVMYFANHNDFHLPRDETANSASWTEQWSLLFFTCSGSQMLTREMCHHFTFVFFVGFVKTPGLFHRCGHSAGQLQKELCSDQSRWLFTKLCFFSTWGIFASYQCVTLDTLKHLQSSLSGGILGSTSWWLSVCSHSVKMLFIILQVTAQRRLR